MSLFIRVADTRDALEVSFDDDAVAVCLGCLSPFPLPQTDRQGYGYPKNITGYGRASNPCPQCRVLLLKNPWLNWQKLRKALSIVRYVKGITLLDETH